MFLFIRKYWTNVFKLRTFRNRTRNYHETIGNQFKTKYVLTLRTWLKLHRGSDYCVWVSTFLHYIEIKGKTGRAGHIQRGLKRLCLASPRFVCSLCICIRRRGGRATRSWQSNIEVNEMFSGSNVDDIFSIFGTGDVTKTEGGDIFNLKFVSQILDL